MTESQAAELIVEIGRLADSLEDFDLIGRTLVDRVALGAVVALAFLALLMAYAGVRYIWNTAYKHFDF